MAILDTEENIKNKQIFKFLHKEKYIPQYNKISEDMGFSKNGTINKYADEFSTNNINKCFTIALEHLYKIPKDIFFNKNITKEEDIIPYVDSCRENTEEEQKQIINHYYLYTLADNKKITKYKIIYKKSHIELEINNEVRYKGSIFDKFGAGIVMIVEHVIKNTTSTLILEREEILNDVAPICITSKDPCRDYKRLLYFGIISQKEIDEEEVISILKDNDDTQNRDMRLVISQRINGI